MSYIVTVVFQADLAELERVERARPELFDPIAKAAEGRMIGHNRYARDGVTMDIDEFATEEDYRAFYAEAEEAILAYGDAAGARGVDTLWRRVEE